MMGRALRFFRTYLAVIAIAGTFVWSAASIHTHRTEEAPPDIKVLRIAHWQLEPGVRAAFETMAAADAAYADDRLSHEDYQVQRKRFNVADR